MAAAATRREIVARHYRPLEKNEELPQQSTLTVRCTYPCDRDMRYIDGMHRFDHKMSYLDVIHRGDTQMLHIDVIR